MFQVGQKLVCVDANEVWGAAAFHGIRKDATYVVRSINRAEGDTQYISVTGATGSWNAKRFRPLIERKASTETGMAILREIARKATKPNRPAKAHSL